MQTNGEGEKKTFLVFKGVRNGFGDNFVGQCEVFVCPDFVQFFFPWLRSL